MCSLLQTHLKNLHCVKPDTNTFHYISHICHILHIVQRHIWEMCVHICTIYEVTTISCMTKRTLRIIHKLHYVISIYHNKHGYQIANIHHNSLILYWHIHLTSVHVCANTKNYNIYFICYYKICARKKTSTNLHIGVIHVMCR